MTVAAKRKAQIRHAERIKHIYGNLGVIIAALIALVLIIWKIVSYYY